LHGVNLFGNSKNANDMEKTNECNDHPKREGSD
jgi:hypothetical protein